MAAGGIVAFKLVIDLRRCAELFLQAVGPDQRRRTVHLVEIADLLRDGDIRRVVVQLLLDQLVTENGAQIVEAHGLAGAGVDQRRGLVLHVRADVVPILGHLRLRQIDLVRNVFGFHSCFSFRVLAFSGKRETKKTFIHRENRLSV